MYDLISWDSREATFCVFIGPEYQNKHKKDCYHQSFHPVKESFAAAASRYISILVAFTLMWQSFSRFTSRKCKVNTNVTYMKKEEEREEKRNPRARTTAVNKEHHYRMLLSKLESKNWNCN